MGVVPLRLRICAMVQHMAVLVLLLGCFQSFSSTAFGQQDNTEYASASPAAAPSFVSAGEISRADSFISEVFSSLDALRYEAAAAAYLALFDRIGETLSPDEAAILARHLRAMAVVMPPADRERAGLTSDPSSEVVLAGLTPGAGAYLARWWRLQDNLPATSSNERLEEHLARYVSALENYGNERDPRGFDDRGEIYVRLGSPSHRTEIELQNIDLVLNIQGLQLPENEFWVYRHVGYDAQYLFAERRRDAGFVVSLPMDLIPRNLQGSRRHSGLLLAWMEEIYGQLALYHNIYGQRYDEVAGYRTLPGANAQRPDIFARSVLYNSNSQDLQNEWQRVQNVPASYSGTHGSAADLPVDVRWSRFLNADGTTRTEIYWAIDRGALDPSRRLVRRLYREGHVPSDDYLLSLYVMQRDGSLRNGQILQKHYLTVAGEGGRLPARTFIAPGDSATYSISLQWEQRWTVEGEAGEASMRPGARLKIATQTLDPLEVLHAGGAFLEMSDIKPLALRESGLPQSGAPYPYAVLSDEIPLALYFEVYNLTYGSGDRTHYSVAYQVSLPDRQEAAETRASTSYAGDERTAREYLIPDLTADDIRRGAEITLRITDETTGQQVSRSILFASGGR